MKKLLCNPYVPHALAWPARGQDNTDALCLSNHHRDTCSRYNHHSEETSTWITQEVLQNSTVTATTLQIAILVYCILIEEYHDVDLSIYQTPHIGLTMAEMSLESLPCLIYVYVATRSQGSILQCLVKPTLLDKQSIRRLDGNEYATLRLLCFWLGC